MSKREMIRAAVLAQVESGAWTLVQAAEQMELSYRQAKRLWKRYSKYGGAAVKKRRDFLSTIGRTSPGSRSTPAMRRRGTRSSPSWFSSNVSIGPALGS